ncbi:NAD(P)-dependent oxidoreductase [Rhizobium sp. LCM 4573]|uniref:NAD-dependent epimerase/dehydratase family protein n=1 Tax=Rhizobium sp. LCM 4573 TaxID=1848291 RepID=UPI0008DA5393|nr:NAD(P)-dependent oxidoreductase [Rhizobium sp. LCM 4573]OHV84908.1 epimerase [Rhizobium sp. LCM 4573]
MSDAASRKVLLTGASGVLGRFLAAELARRYPGLVLTDILPFPDKVLEGARFVQADLADAGRIAEITEGVDTIIHFGGVANEKSFETILPANIVGTVNVFEAARTNRARVIFASSNHTIGFHERDRKLGIADRVKPDGFYGVSKLFGENVGSFYFDKFGVESVHLRIGSALRKPTETRHLSTWLSYPDLLRMVVASIEAEKTGYALLWGVSANTRSWWGEDDAARLGYRAEDNAEVFADKVTADPDDPIARRFQGGSFTSQGYGRAPEGKS